MTDKDGTIQSFNRVAETIFRYAVEEAIGQNVRSLMPEPDRGAHDNCLAAHRETGEPKIIGVGREVVGRRKDGSVVSLDLSIAEWRRCRRPAVLHRIMRDVTIRNQQARELQRATEIAK